MWKLSSWYRHTCCCQYLPPSYFILLAALLPLMSTVVFGSALPYRYPEYNDTPDNVTYYRGDRAILRCSVKNLGTNKVYWKKANLEHVLTFGTMVFHSDNDLSVDHIPHRNEYNLVITNVQPDDAGQYECHVTTVNPLTKFVTLNVKDEPAPRSEAIKITGKAYVEKGEKIVLTCNATSELFPPEDVDWFKDGRKVKQNQYKGVTIAKFRIAETRTLHSMLEIEHSDMDDAGNYICRSSDLAITDMNVMVLNAETNHSKRDNNYPAASEAGNAATTALNHHDRLLSYLLTFLCFTYIASNTFHRQ